MNLRIYTFKVQIRKVCILDLKSQTRILGIKSLQLLYIRYFNENTGYESVI